MFDDADDDGGDVVRRKGGAAAVGGGRRREFCQTDSCVVDVVDREMLFIHSVVFFVGNFEISRLYSIGQSAG